MRISFSGHGYGYGVPSFRSSVLAKLQQRSVQCSAGYLGSKKKVRGEEGGGDLIWFWFVVVRVGKWRGTCVLCDQIEVGFRVSGCGGGFGGGEGRSSLEEVWLEDLLFRDWSGGVGAKRRAAGMWFLEWASCRGWDA